MTNKMDKELEKLDSIMKDIYAIGWRGASPNFPTGKDFNSAKSRLLELIKSEKMKAFDKGLATGYKTKTDYGGRPQEPLQVNSKSHTYLKHTGDNNA